MRRINVEGAQGLLTPNQLVLYTIAEACLRRVTLKFLLKAFGSNKPWNQV